MNKLLRSFILFIMRRRQDLPETQLNNYVLLLVVAVVSCSVHVFFAVFFTVNGCVPLGVGHIIGVAVFIAAYIMLENGMYDLAGVIVTLMIFSSSIETIHFIGGDNYSLLYQVTTLVMMVMVPFSNKKIPMVSMVLIPLVMVASHVYDMLHTPAYSIGAANDALAVMNIAINSGGVIIMLSLEKAVRGFVESYKAEQYRRLEDQAYLDPLTGLHNRRYANLYFDELTHTPAIMDVCVAMGDLDDFKVVNDTYGHDAGDATLRMASQLMLEHTRKSDLVCRWGGEEFLIVLKNASPQDSVALLNKIRLRIAETPIHHEGKTFYVTMTLGGSQLKNRNAAACIDRCDKNLYQGKNSGKNKVVFK